MQISSLDKYFSTTILSSQVLHVNLLYSVLEYGNFLNSDVWQGSVATFVKYGGIFDADFVAHFTDESVSEKIMTIG